MGLESIGKGILVLCMEEGMFRVSRKSFFRSLGIDG